MSIKLDALPAALHFRNSIKDEKVADFVCYSSCRSCEDLSMVIKYHQFHEFELTNFGFVGMMRKLRMTAKPKEEIRR